MNKTIQQRVAELSATLNPITDNPLHGSAEDELWGEANDFISYNSPYYCNGLQRVDFDGFANVCVMETAGEFQVLRFVYVNIYLSGEMMYNYYSNEFIHQEDPNWMDDEFYEPDELEIKEVKEYKQIWIADNGDVFCNDITDSCANNTDCFVNIKGLQNWVYDPAIKCIILSYVNEITDYCYTDNEEVPLEYYLSKSCEYLHNNENAFYNEIVKHGLCKNAQPFFRSFRVAHRHGYKFPTDYNDTRMYLDYLTLLSYENTDLLTQPYYVCPDNLERAYIKLDNRRQELLENKEKAEAHAKEEEFAEQHSWLFGIEFSTEHFHFQSLDSVEAYRIEGKIMHHCIYDHEYFKKPYFLAMHITDLEGNRVATCTIDLLRRGIDAIQPMCNDTGFFRAYGIRWQDTNDYKHIWNTLMARMHTFPKRKPQPTEQQQIKIA